MKVRLHVYVENAHFISDEDELTRGLEDFENYLRDFRSLTYLEIKRDGQRIFFNPDKIQGVGIALVD